MYHWAHWVQQIHRQQTTDFLNNPVQKLPDADNLIVGFESGRASNPLICASAEPGLSAFRS